MGWKLGEQGGAHDVAAIDVDVDGDLDLVMGQGLGFGTRVWLNQTVPNHLFWDVASLSVGLGGTQVLDLDAGEENAGKLYLVLGSVSGTSPGVPTAAGVLPLVFDPYFEHLLTSPGTPPVPDGLGILGGAGRASVSFVLPPASDPGLVGALAHHAYAVVDPVAGSVDLVSEAAPLRFDP